MPGKYSLQKLAVLLAAAVAVVDAVPFDSRNTEPCAAVAKLQQSQLRAGNNETLAVPGDAARACLKSIPFYPELTVAFIDEYSKYLQFQSTIETLKNPPAGYLSPPVDLLGGIENIREKAANSNYTSQYDFEMELLDLITSANDGHLSVKLCTTALFPFESKIPLVSASKDGLELPQIYTFGDALQRKKGSKIISAVSSINGEDPTKYLTDNIPPSTSFQDPDARYNSFFLSKEPSSAQGISTGGFAVSSFWPGTAIHSLKFANGSTHNVSVSGYWTTASNGPFNYTNGAELFKAQCMPSPDSDDQESSDDDEEPKYPKPFSNPSLYPKAVARNPYNLISGYYLNESGVDDVAVLSVPTFMFTSLSSGEALPPNNTEDVSKLAGDFIKESAAAGKKKIIVDLTNNPGGDVLSGFNLFRLFFPNAPVNSGSRFRSHELVDYLGKLFQRTHSEDGDYQVYAYQDAVTANQSAGFSSWKELYGPHEILGTNVSSLHANMNFTSMSSSDDPISGFGPVPSISKEPTFKADDIVILTDGRCSSTCSVFTENMKGQGVRSIAIGGRPSHGPMQAIGGVKGSQELALTGIYSFVQQAVQAGVKAAAELSPLLTIEEDHRFAELSPVPIKDFPYKFNGGGVNLRNAYSPNDDQTPLQFVYEAAECRLFYTVENIFDQGSVWRDVAKAMFKGGKCIQGSTKGVGSLDASHGH